MKFNKKSIFIAILLFSIACYACDLNDDLLDACKRCDLKRSQSLIEGGASVNAKSDEGMTALMYAVTCGQIELVDLILHNDPAVDKKDNTGRTALFIACEYGNTEIAARLIDRGAQFTKDIWGRSLLDIAVHRPETDMALIKLLIEELEIRSKMFDRLGHALCYTYSPEVMEYLVSLGADVNYRSKNGATPLSFAITGIGFPNYDTAKFLIEHGADVNARDEDGWTPLLIAVSEGLPDLVELLLSNGADWQSRIKKGPFKGLNALEIAEKLTDKQFLEEIPPMSRQKYETPTFKEEINEIIALLKNAGAKE